MDRYNVPEVDQHNKMCGVSTIALYWSWLHAKKSISATIWRAVNWQGHFNEDLPLFSQEFLELITDLWKGLRLMHRANIFERTNDNLNLLEVYIEKILKFIYDQFSYFV